MSSARYRVTINGFRCNTQTWDDAGNWDGKADEVFISTSIKYVGKDGNMLFETQSQSPVMGDINNQPNRIQAGNAWGGRGGIISGDAFPTNSPWMRSTPLDQARDFPPMTIWEGELTKGEQTVFITPTIWEWDPGESMWEGWMRWQAETDERFGKKAKEIMTGDGGIIPGFGWIFDAVSLGIQTAATLFDVDGPAGNSGSRPIGFKKDLEKDPKGKAFSFNPWVLPLNYDLAELLITQEPNGHGLGVLDIPYDEDPYFRGDYTLYIQVERVASSGTIPSSTHYIDAVVRWDNAKAYFFRGSQYARYDLGTDRVDAGYPVPIAGSWRGLWPDDIDAAVELGNGKVYFFKGNQYMRYDIAADQVDAGYPAPIAGGWRGLWPDGIDAAVNWGNGKVYFFKGNQYMRYDIAADQVDAGYPAPIAGGWRGLWPDGIDAAVRWNNGKAYFFKGSHYIRYDMATDQAEGGEMPIEGHWAGLRF